MSDGAIATIVSGVVTVSLGLIGFLTLWLKIRYGTEQAEKAAQKAEKAVAHAAVVETKIDQNTAISTEAKDAAQKAEKQTNGVLLGYDTHITRLIETAAEHHRRISDLEMKIAELQLAIDVVNKNVDTTRHEFRGTLQTITNKLDLIAFSKPTPNSQPVVTIPIPGTGPK